MVDLVDGKIVLVQDPSGDDNTLRVAPELNLPQLNLSTLKTSPNKVRCAVSLQLMMDESNSVSDANWRMQLDAYAAAFKDSDIIQKIKEAPGGIEVMAISFGNDPRIRIPFGLIQNEKDALNYAGLLEQIGTQIKDGTEIGKAAIQGTNLFETGYCKYSKRVQDFSSDMQDTLTTIAAGRDYAESRGVTINGLVVANSQEDIAKGLVTAKEHLKTTDGFVMATDYHGFAEAIKKKLALEIAEATKVYKEAQLKGDHLQDGGWVAPTPIPALQNGTGSQAKAIQTRF